SIIGRIAASSTATANAGGSTEATAAANTVGTAGTDRHGACGLRTGTNRPGARPGTNRPGARTGTNPHGARRLRTGTDGRGDARAHTTAHRVTFVEEREEIVRGLAGPNVIVRERDLILNGGVRLDGPARRRRHRDRGRHRDAGQR